jgi:DNA/RNA-binding domain of Phe-tRNA-synthetase-like protein
LIPHGIDLRVDPEIQDRLRVGTVSAAPVRVGPAGERLRAAIREAAARLRDRHGGRSPAEIPELGAARELYRAFGIDPTRTRPSSESLLRRVLRSEPLPEIRNAVDLGNLCALLFLLPIGLYDAARIRDPVTLRRGLPEERYRGIRKDVVHLAGRLTLADAEGPFGNPTSDSLRTAVTDETKELWMVVFAPGGFPAARLAAHLETVRALIASHLAAADPVRTATSLVPGGG